MGHTVGFVVGGGFGGCGKRPTGTLPASFVVDSFGGRPLTFGFDHICCSSYTAKVQSHILPKESTLVNQSLKKLKFRDGLNDTRHKWLILNG
jgi:hypothetical protein